MAKKAKGNRIQVILECTEHKDSGMPGTSRYITTKNRKNTPDRMEIKKFNPVLKKYTVHIHWTLSNIFLCSNQSDTSGWLEKVGKLTTPLASAAVASTGYCFADKLKDLNINYKT